jgi:hypothetical protein
MNRSLNAYEDEQNADQAEELSIDDSKEEESTWEDEAGVLWKENSDVSFLWQDAQGTWCPLVEEPAAMNQRKRPTPSV